MVCVRPCGDVLLSPHACRSAHVLFRARFWFGRMATLSSVLFMSMVTKTWLIPLAPPSGSRLPSNIFHKRCFLSRSPSDSGAFNDFISFKEKQQNLLQLNPKCFCFFTVMHLVCMCCQLLYRENGLYSIVIRMLERRNICGGLAWVNIHTSGFLDTSQHLLSIIMSDEGEALPSKVYNPAFTVAKKDGRLFWAEVSRNEISVTLWLIKTLCYPLRWDFFFFFQTVKVLSHPLTVGILATVNFSSSSVNWNE